MKAPRRNRSAIGRKRGPGRIPGCRIAIVTLMALALFSGFPSAIAVVYETEAEFFSNGDFDGDGRDDVVVVDRRNGSWQVGYQLSVDTLTWSDPRSSGFRTVNGFSVGRILNLSTDALVFANAETGRVHILDASDPDRTPAPVTVIPAGFGVGPLVAVDIAGIDNTGLHDLLAITRWNDPPDPIRWETLRNVDGVFSRGTGGTTGGTVRELGRVIIRRGVCEYAVMMREGETTDLLAWRMSLGRVRETLTVPDLPLGARYVSGFFGGGYAAQFLTYLPGRPAVTAHPVLEYSPGEYRLEPPESHELGGPIDRLYVIEENSPPRLLVVFENRRTAAVIDYDGVSFSAEVQSFSVPADRVIHGALTADAAGFLLLTGDDRASDRYVVWRKDGLQYVEAGSGQLGGGVAPQPAANLFLFQFEPFVSPHPLLLQRLRAGTWTSAPVLVSGPPRQLNVSVETFNDPTRGLEKPSATLLGGIVAQAGFVLPNQYRPDVAIRSYAAAVGLEVVELRLSPSPGRWGTAVEIAIDATPSSADVFYQLGAGQSWMRYQGPFWLARAAALRYYGVLPGGAISPIHSAAYTFAFSPDELDTDRDGVPDYVEIGTGLPPDGGSDTDGDGFSDLEELIAGTHPGRANDRPAAGTRLEAGTAFDLELVPRPYDGTLPGPTTSSPGTGVQLADLQGNLVARAEVRASDTGGPALALFPDLVVDRRQRLLAAASDPHFPLMTAGTDKRLGRELLKLLPVPDVPAGFVVPYAFGGDSFAAEAERWVAAARTAAAAQQRRIVRAEMTVVDTLAALLFERQLEAFLSQLGAAPADGITLFPHRPADATRRSPSVAELSQIETRVPGGFPGYNLTGLLDTLETRLQAAATTEVQALIEVATEIYRTSSAFHNVNPGVHAPPVDVLRSFLDGDPLNSVYLASSTLTEARRTQAAAGVTVLLSGLTGRPVVQKDLLVTAATGASGCTVLEDPAGTPYNLTFADGRPYTLPESFDLPVDTRVRVTAHTDGPSARCTGQSLEVLTLTLVSLPALPAAGLADHSAGGPLSMDGDADGDGRSDLQEFFDGTNPLDSGAHGEVAVSVHPPPVRCEPGVRDGEMILAWRYPAQYAGRVTFVVRRAEFVDGPYAALAGRPVETRAGQFEVTVPIRDRTGFFQVVMELK